MPDFTTADLFGQESAHLQPARPGGFDRPSASADAIRRDGGGRFYTFIEKEPWRTLERRRDLDAYRVLMWESLRNSLPMRVGLQSLTGLQNEPPVHGQLIELATYKRGEFDSRSARLTGAYGVRYLIAAGSVEAPEMTLVSRGVLHLYRNEIAVPRAHLVPESRTVPNPDAALALLKRPTRPASDRGDGTEGPPIPTVLWGGRGRHVHEEPDRLAIETACVRAAWLVLNDTFAPVGPPRSTATDHGARANRSVRAVRWGGTSTTSSSCIRPPRSMGAWSPVRPGRGRPSRFPPCIAAYNPPSTDALIAKEIGTPHWVTRLSFTPPLSSNRERSSVRNTGLGVRTHPARAVIGRGATSAITSSSKGRARRGPSHDQARCPALARDHARGRRVRGAERHFTNDSSRAPRTILASVRGPS